MGTRHGKSTTQTCACPSCVTTPKGEETAYSYDAVGRRMSISNSYGTVEMAYNSRNFVTSRTDGEGYTYQGKKQEDEETDADKGV